MEGVSASQGEMVSSLCERSSCGGESPGAAAATVAPPASEGARRRPGRPTLSASERRSKRLSVSLPASALARFERQAEAEGHRLSPLLARELLERVSALKAKAPLRAERWSAVEGSLSRMSALFPEVVVELRSSGRCSPAVRARLLSELSELEQALGPCWEEL